MLKHNFCFTPKTIFMHTEKETQEPDPFEGMTPEQRAAAIEWEKQQPDYQCPIIESMVETAKELQRGQITQEEADKELAKLWELYDQEYKERPSRTEQEPPGELPL